MANQTQDQTLHLVGTPYSVGFIAVVLILDVFVFVNGVFGNLLLIMVMCRTKVKGFPKVFIGNLALADLMVVLGSVPTSFLSFVLGFQPVVNLTHCRVNAAILNISYSVSITTLITVSFNRFMKICYPLTFCRIFTSNSRNLAICVGLWGGGVMGNLPVLNPTMTPTNFNPDSHTCIGRGDSMSADYANIVMFIFLIMPVFVISYFNVAIYRCLDKSTKKMRKKRIPDVGSASPDCSAKPLVREVTAVEVVLDKENPHQTMSTDNEDTKPETHCAAEFGSVKEEENKEEQSTYASSTTASNCAPGLRDEEMPARNLGEGERASTSSNSSEIATLFHEIATAVGSQVPSRNTVGSPKSLYPDNCNSENVNPSNNNDLNTNSGSNDLNTNSGSNDLNTNSGSNDMNITNEISDFYSSTGNTDLAAVSSTKNKSFIHSSTTPNPPRRPEPSVMRKTVRPEMALVKSLLVISLTLFVLYTPYTTIIFLSFFDVDIPPGVTLISTVLLGFNCAANWIIYGVLNTMFREAYINMLRPLLSCCRR